MAIWKCKGCPRCGGDMFMDRDMDTWYEQCLQCSYRQELKSIAGLKKQSAHQEKGLAFAGEGRSKKRNGT